MKQYFQNVYGLVDR